MTKSLHSKIIEILTPPEPREAREYGGVVDWEFKYNKEGAEFLADQILELFKKEKQKAIEDYAKDVIPKITDKWRGYLKSEKEKLLERIKLEERNPNLPGKEEAGWKDCVRHLEKPKEEIRNENISN